MTQRKPFYEEVFERGEAFAKALLQDIPELEGLAIIPSWVVEQEHLPSGQIIGREGPLRTPAEVFKMTVQLSTALRQQQETVFEILRFLDAKLGEIAAELRQKQQQLDEIDAKLGGQPSSS